MDNPLRDYRMDEDPFFAGINLLAAHGLGWMSKGEGGLLDDEPPLICSCCLDHPAGPKGCIVCRTYLCEMCVLVCPNCNGNVCLTHMEYFAIKRIPQLCRNCAERAVGKLYLEETDEMYRMHNEGTTPQKEE